MTQARYTPLAVFAIPVARIEPPKKRVVGDLDRNLIIPSRLLAKSYPLPSVIPVSQVSADRTIANAMVRLVLFVLVAKGLGALKEVGLAAYYGVGPLMDAYLLNFSIANTLASTWLGILSAILVPLLIHQRNPPVDVELFRGELVGWTVLVGVTLALIYAFIMPGVAKLPALGLPVATASLVGAQAIFLCALVPLGFLSGLATCFLSFLQKAHFFAC